MRRRTKIKWCKTLTGNLMRGKMIRHKIFSFLGIIDKSTDQLIINGNT